MRWSQLRWIALATVVALIGLGAWVLSTTVLSDAWSRSQIDLVETFTRNKPNPDWPWLEAEDRTASVCAPPVDCVRRLATHG